MVPVGSSVMLELVVAVHRYHVIAYLGILREINLAIFYKADSISDLFTKWERTSMIKACIFPKRLKRPGQILKPRMNGAKFLCV